MRVVDGLAALSPLDRCVLTIGNFDGVHRAHQQLLSQAGMFSAQNGAPVVVLTFEPHPLAIVAPKKNPPRLQTPEEKLRCLEEAGADVTVVAHSEPSLLGLKAEDFIRDIIWDRFHPTHVVEGPSFGFGRGRKGTPALMQQWGKDLGFSVHLVEPVTLRIDDETLMVSSSLIRRLISEGKVRRAGLCLGRPHTLIGTVETGERRGQQLGFPTANLAVADQLVPADGVYAGHAVVGDLRKAAAISIGTKPTFEGTERRIEAHLLDFDGDLYGASLRLEFHDWIRGQQRFGSAEALVTQLKRDVQAVREGRNMGNWTPTDRETAAS